MSPTGPILPQHLKDYGLPTGGILCRESVM
jgi:hypothetical protein